MDPDKLTGGNTVFGLNENSMGAAIERQLNRLFREDFMAELPTENTQEARDRRRMFAAIARGVIEHLAANPHALQVVMTSAPHDESDYEGHVVIQGNDIA
jgi:hypothetical protein